MLNQSIVQWMCLNMSEDMKALIACYVHVGNNLGFAMWHWNHQHVFMSWIHHPIPMLMGGIPMTSPRWRFWSEPRTKDDPPMQRPALKVCLQRLHGWSAMVDHHFPWKFPQSSSNIGRPSCRILQYISSIFGHHKQCPISNAIAINHHQPPYINCYIINYHQP